MSYLVGCMMMVAIPAAAPAINDPMSPGASLCWTSDLPVIRQAREWIRQGQLRQAEDAVKADPSPDAQAKRAKEETLEIIRRIRMEYALTAPELLKKVQRTLPNATADDLERWRLAGGVQFRVLDGKICYFNREPANIWRFCKEASEQRDKLQGKTAAPNVDRAPKLIEHIKQVIAEAKRTGKAEVCPLKHRIHYTLTVEPNRPGAKAGSTVRCWLPYAQEYRWQKAPTLIRTVPAKAFVAPNVVDTMPLGGSPHRTIYLEQTITDPAKPVVFEAEFEYVPYAYYPILKPELAQPLPADWGDKYLRERPPHLMHTPEMKATVARLVGDEKNPLERARRIFHFVCQEIAYNAEQEYCYIPSFSLKAWETRRADCGVQAMIFIALCQIAGVPARWQTGWETKPDDSSNHDWAEMYIEPWGWLPVDVTYGLRVSDDPEVREFYLGHIDAYRMITNIDYGMPLQPPKESLRSEPSDFQRGEVELDGRNLYFDEWDYHFNFEVTPVKETSTGGR